jgi:hypothetical protein
MESGLTDTNQKRLGGGKGRQGEIPAFIPGYLGEKYRIR